VGRLRALDDLFNAGYSIVVNDLEAAFSTETDRLGTGIDHMLSLVQATAKYMMTLQISPNGCHVRPTFRYDANVRGGADLVAYVRALDEVDRDELRIDESDLAGAR
jgi:hypothetical protein